MLDLSLTTSVIFPAFVGFFAIEIVKPGPTVPVNLGVAAKTGSAAIAHTVRAMARTAVVSFLTFPSSSVSTNTAEESSRTVLARRRETRRGDRLPCEHVVVRAGEPAHPDRPDPAVAVIRGHATPEEGEERVEARPLGRVLAGL